MLITVPFPDHAFNEDTHISCFHEWNVFLITPFVMRDKNLRMHAGKTHPENKTLMLQSKVFSTC